MARIHDALMMLLTVGRNRVLSSVVMLFLYIAMLLLFTMMFISVCSLLLLFRWTDVSLSLSLVHSSVHSLIYVDLVLPAVEVSVFLCFFFVFFCHADLFSRVEMHVFARDHASPRAVCNESSRKAMHFLARSGALSRARL